MIITNSVIKVNKDFENKIGIKNYLYSFIENHPFRQYNQKIANEFGEDLFSMTFVPSNIVVLTQRYPTEKLYLDSISLRDDIEGFLLIHDIIEYYKVSHSIEI
tara:strand:- start:13173 stop:13481 length:309 start_codon:yes stop_codon:yes gene_type:complete